MNTQLVAACLAVLTVGIRCAEDNGAKIFTTYNGEDSDFPAAWLKAHNDLRALHGVPALTWDEDLAAGSAEWALVQAKAETFDHDKGDFGENMFVGSASLTDSISTPAAATYEWYSEEWTVGFAYNEGLPPTNDAGHFTQVVWKETGKLGCGGATYFSDGYYNTLYVCRYSPAANLQTDDAYNANVLPRASGVPAPGSYAEIELTCHDQSPDCGGFSSLCGAYTFLQQSCPLACGKCS